MVKVTSPADVSHWAWAKSMMMTMLCSADNYMMPASMPAIMSEPFHDLGRTLTTEQRGQASLISDSTPFHVSRFTDDRNTFAWESSPKSSPSSLGVNKEAGRSNVKKVPSCSAAVSKCRPAGVPKMPKSPLRMRADCLQLESPSTKDRRPHVDIDNISDPRLRHLEKQSACPPSHEFTTTVACIVESSVCTLCGSLGCMLTAICI
jgi:hypothetical protein